MTINGDELLSTDPDVVLTPRSYDSCRSRLITSGAKCTIPLAQGIQFLVFLPLLRLKAGKMIVFDSLDGEGQPCTFTFWLSGSGVFVNRISDPEKFRLNGGEVILSTT